MNNINSDKSNSNKNNSKVKRPTNPKYISKAKYFKVSTRDSNRIKNIKEGMNHLFNIRNHELEEAFLQEAAQYAKRVLEESRRMNTSEADDEEIMNKVFRRSEEGAIEEEILEKEPEEESETLNSEEVWELNERIQEEDQEEYDRIRAEMEEEEEANKYN